jgi:hypothetical protein
VTAGADHVGELQAWNMQTGERAWTHEFESPNWGPVLATAGGLVFAGGTTDRYFRAFDAASGHDGPHRPRPRHRYDRAAGRRRLGVRAADALTPSFPIARSAGRIPAVLHRRHVIDAADVLLRPDVEAGTHDLQKTDRRGTAVASTERARTSWHMSCTLSTRSSGTGDDRFRYQSHAWKQRGE